MKHTGEIFIQVFIFYVTQMWSTIVVDGHFTQGVDWSGSSIILFSMNSQMTLLMAEMILFI
jgi:hypothetical protein